MKLFEVECTDKRTGTHVYDVNQLTEFGRPVEGVNIKKKAISNYIESKQYDALFSDYTKGNLDSFLSIFLNPRSVWLEIVRQSDGLNVGSMYMTDIILYYDADVHFSLWDSISRGREPIMTEAMLWAMDKFQLRRLTAEIPAHQSGVIRFAQRLGFIEEGRRREAIYHKDTWVEAVILGILKDEVKNGKQY